MTKRVRVAGWALAVVLAVFPVSGAGADEVGLEFIGVDEVRRLQQTPRRLLIMDVRSSDEFQEAHIKGAVNIPLLELERRFAEVPKQGLVVLY